MNYTNGHEDCTTDLYRAASLSKYEMRKEIDSQLQDIVNNDGRATKWINDATRDLNLAK